MDLGRQEGTAAPALDAPTLLKLNLGCGVRKFDGFVNVDKYGEPDVKCDLEAAVWPWPDSSADEVRLIHVLEHLGGTPDTFRHVLQELFRVCAGGAKVLIVVPHARHDNFLGDPTHVRAITPQLLSLFDREQCEAWKAAGYANSPLALYWGVDFRVADLKKVPAEPYKTLLHEGAVTVEELATYERELNNVIEELQVVWEVRK